MQISMVHQIGSVLLITAQGNSKTDLMKVACPVEQLCVLRLQVPGIFAGTEQTMGSPVDPFRMVSADLKTLLHRCDGFQAGVLTPAPAQAFIKQSFPQGPVRDLHGLNSQGLKGGNKDCQPPAITGFRSDFRPGRSSLSRWPAAIIRSRIS